MEPGVMIWLLVAALSAAGVLAIAEITSRWWVRRRSRYHVWPAHARIEIRMDPDVFPQLERRTRFYINADGERGADVRADEPGLYRILAAGGSAVECFALDQASSWPGALERLLNTAGSLAALGARLVHVGNIGHSGVGSADLDLILSRVLPQYRRLDAILIMVGASDIYHWLEDGALPTRPPSTVPESLLFAGYPRQPFGWKPREWALLEVARRLRRTWFHPSEVKERAGAWFAKARLMRAHATEILTTMPHPAVVLTHFEHHFSRLVRAAQATANRVLVVRQPWFEGDYTTDEAAHFWHGGVGKAWKESITVYYGLDVVNRLLELIDSRAAHIAETLGVAHVDLRPLLNQGLRHYYDHDHHTPAGAAIVARAVADALLPRLAVRLPADRARVESTRAS
jgi:lysophospholipase L1-like esterase